MESGGGSRGGCRRSRTLSKQSCYLQGALLVFFILTIHVQLGVSERDKSVTSIKRDGSAEPWNKTLYKTEGNCTKFRPQNASLWFFYWPEADPAFDFCCAPNTDYFKDYTYGSYGPKLYNMEYIDVGLIDSCMPYWNCLHLFEDMIKYELYMAYCEFNDLTNFYRRRFLYDTMLYRGLLQSAIPFILMAEISVLVSIAVYWFLRRRRAPMDVKVLRVATKAWQRAVRKTVVKDWTHLCLLAFVGNGLIESMGRQIPAAACPQSKMLFNYARLYLVLSILVWYSSVLHQISIYIAEIEGAYDAARSADSGISRQPSEAVKLEDEIGLGKDWEWQPIGAQAGILFCLWGYLTQTQSDATTGAVFGIIVSAACPWSGLNASKVIAHTFPWILVRVYQNLFQGRNAGASHRSYRSLWAKAFKLRSGVSYFQLVNPP